MTTTSTKKVFLVFGVVVLLVLGVGFSGCIGDDDDDEEDEEDEEDEDVEGEYWNAFEFEDPVMGESEAGGYLQNVEEEEENGEEELGTLKGFTYEHTYIEDGSEKQFEIETSYEGITETEITVTRFDQGDYSESTESEDLEAYEVVHTVTVIEDEENEDHPEWVELTVYLPTEDYSTEDVDSPIGSYPNFFIYAKAEYLDSEDNEAMFSYYLTEDMRDEMEEDDDIFYLPYTENEDEFGDYDAWILYGLYGFGWTWFEPFTTDYGLAEGSWDIPTPEGSFSYEVEESTEELSGYIFTSYDVSAEVTFEGNAQLEGTFVPSLPVPVHLQVGDESRTYEMELTEIEIE